MSDKLKKYNDKRSFDKTAEPEGKIARGEKRRRFVVQHHAASRNHYDLRLELGGVLVSWAVPKGPSFNTKDKRLAVHVEDHPLEYRNFEGTIPKGQYGGGTVMIWDEGYWTAQKGEPCSVDEGSFKIVLDGMRLKGKWALVRMKGKEGDKADNWLLIKEKDDFASDTDVISGYDRSIRTGRTMEEIENGLPAGEVKKNPFSKTNVQLATLVHSLPKEGKWVYELKYDGYRIIAYAEDGKAVLLSRNGNDYTKYFQDIAAALAELSAGRPMVLDGEIVVTDENGRSDFSALQKYIKGQKGDKPQYVVFDLLALDGADLRGEPLLDRKAKLKELTKKAPDDIHYSGHSEKTSKDNFEKVCSMNFEGIIGKRADSVYSGSRNGDWIKLKCDTRQEFVIGGYTQSDKNAEGVSSLLLGYFEGKNLIYAGRTGTGMAGETQRELKTEFEKLSAAASPFTSIPAKRSGEELFWLKPELAAEIKFAEWTKDGLLRQASFKGLRADKNVDEIVREESVKEREPVKEKQSSTNLRGVEISSPQKLLFTSPQVTKLEVAEYYDQISERMLPYIRNRIMSLVCCPKGVGSCHFRKHLPDTAAGIEKILADKSEDDKYFCVTEASGLIHLVQMNTIEFHTWGCTKSDPEKPDVMVFDLDPDEGMDIQDVRRGVTDLKSILDELSLISFLKTSGGKGYHIVVPFTPSADWETFRIFAKSTAEIMEQKWPDRYTSNMRKEKRKGRIFIDWVRNGRGATSVAPYSLRARDGAHISMPVSWEGLYSVKPDDVTVSQALRQLKDSDPWLEFFKIKETQRLK